ncbi:MAG: SDR family NAD(P)-dependent oxidoreductase [Pseudomonadota bacterium]
MAYRALVTGGNRGLGLAISKGLIDQGLEVIIASRNASSGELAAREIGAKAIKLDLMRPEGFATSLDDAGEIDVLVNNAGVLHEGSMLRAPEDFIEAMQVMVHAPYELIRLLSPHMGARGYGRIVNVSSGWGSFSEGLGGPGPYGVAKAALNAITKALSRELPQSVKINAMCPGWLRTRMGGPSATRSASEGAETALWLATLPDDGPTGAFFRDKAQISW